MMKNKYFTEFKKNKLFEGVSDSKITIKFNPKNLISIKEGDIVYQKGETSKYVYLVLEGDVKLKIAGIFSSPIVVQKHQYDFFGEMELFDGTKRKSSVVADNDVVLFPVTKEELNKYSLMNKGILQTIFKSNKYEEPDAPKQPEMDYGFKRTTERFDPNEIDKETKVDEKTKKDVEKKEEKQDDVEEEFKIEDESSESTEDLLKETDVSEKDVPESDNELKKEFLDDPEDYMNWDFTEGEEKEEINIDLEEPQKEEEVEGETVKEKEEEPEEEKISFKEHAPDVSIEDEDFMDSVNDDIPKETDEKSEDFEKDKFEIEEPKTEEEPIQFEEEAELKEEEVEDEVVESDEIKEDVTPFTRNVEPEGGLSEDKLKLIIKAAQKVNSNIKLDQVLSSIVEAASNLTGADRGTLYIVDRERGELWSKIISGKDVKEIRLEIGQGLAGSAAQKNEIINIKDVSSDPRFEANFDKTSGYKTENMLCFPINNKEGEVIAVLQLLNSSKGVFNTTDEEMLSMISINAALALENAELVDKLLQADRLSSLGKMANFLIQDIKKPILTVKHYAEHLKKKDVSDDVKQVLSMLIDQVNTVTDLVQTTLSYSEGKSILQTKELNIKEAMDEILGLLAEYVESRNVKLFKKYETEKTVNVDTKELYQACFQIAKNSCDAMHEGGNLYVLIADNDNSVEIKFKDDGLGIPESIKDRIFEPFMSHGKKQGTGLGLSIAQKIIKDHDGKIFVDSDLGEGAEVIISLPVVQ